MNRREFLSRTANSFLGALFMGVSQENLLQYGGYFETGWKCYDQLSGFDNFEDVYHNPALKGRGVYVYKYKVSREAPQDILPVCSKLWLPQTIKKAPQ